MDKNKFTALGTQTGRLPAVLKKLPSSALQLAKEGVSKQQMLSLLTNSWELSAAELLAYGITGYHLRRLDSQWLKDNIKEGSFTYDLITYCAIYRSCNPATMTRYKNIRVSFRESDVGNFALLQPVMGE